MIFTILQLIKDALSQYGVAAVDSHGRRSNSRNHVTVKQLARQGFHLPDANAAAALARLREDRRSTGVE